MSKEEASLMHIRTQLNIEIQHLSSKLQHIKATYASVHRKLIHLQKERILKENAIAAKLAKSTPMEDEFTPEQIQAALRMMRDERKQQE